MAEIRKIKIPTEQSPRDLIDAVSIVDVTQAQYDALPATKTSDGKRYYITDQYKIMHNGVAYGGGSGGTPSASNVTYDGTTSGLQATNVQSAIDEEVANTASSFSSVTTALGTKANVLDLAPAFSTSTAYAVGDYVIYEGHLYKCTTAHAAGAWVAADFAEADVCTEKMDVNGSNAASEVKFNGAFTVGSRASGSNIGIKSVAEGYNTTASGQCSHAEGYYTTASGQYSHAEGYYTTAGYIAHVEGASTTASGECSHAEGHHTTAGYDLQHVQGQYNDNKSTTLFEIGNGYTTSEIHKNNNAFEVYLDGKISQDNGTTKFKFTNYNNQDGYYDSADTFHPFGGGDSFYLEKTNISSITYTFSDSRITASSVVDVYTDTWGDNPTNVAITVSSGTGTCTVTFAAAKSRTVRVYFK